MKISQQVKAEKGFVAMENTRLWQVALYAYAMAKRGRFEMFPALGQTSGGHENSKLAAETRIYTDAGKQLLDLDIGQKNF